MKGLSSVPPLPPRRTQTSIEVDLKSVPPPPKQSKCLINFSTISEQNSILLSIYFN